MSIRYLSAIAGVAAVLAGPPANGAESGGSGPEPGAETLPAETAPAKPRLRFRSKGPACMCLDGLNEAEIAAAERARKQSADDLPAIIQNP